MAISIEYYRTIDQHHFFCHIPFGLKEQIKALVNSYKWINKPESGKKSIHPSIIWKTWRIPALWENVVNLESKFKVSYSPDAQRIRDYLDIERTNIVYIKKIRNDPNWRLDGDEYASCFQNQCVGIEISKYFPTYGIFFDSGTGKTLTSIKIIQRYRREELPGLKTLIVCPIGVINDVWIEGDLKKYAPELKAISLWRDFALLNEPADIYLINYVGFKTILEELITAKFDMIIVDESSKMKNHNSQITKAILKIRDYIPRRFILSATPWPNSLLECWAQMAFINPRLLGDNYFNFRSRFFYNSPGDRTGYKYIVLPGRKKELLSLISQRAVFYSKKECLPYLPDLIMTSRTLSMSNDQAIAHEQMRTKLLIEFEDTTKIRALNQLAKIMKLRQITSGYMYHPDGGGLIKISDTKFDELEDVLEKMGNNQVIVWINFKFEAEEILRRLGDKACAYYGGVSKKEQELAKTQFKSGDKLYFIANSASAGHGLNLQMCYYNIYFSLNYSAELEKQSMDRTNRQGQKNDKVYYLYLLCRESIDEMMFDCIRNKRKISEEALNWLKN